MKLRSKRMGQKPFVSNACVATEIAVTAIFSRSKSALIGAADTGAIAGLAPGATMRFNLA